MTNKPSFRIVPPAAKAKATDEMRKRRIASGRRILLNAALAYISDGANGTKCDRLRTASDLSGIPRNLLHAHIQA